MTSKIYSIIFNSSQYVEYERYDNSHIKTIEDNSYLFEYNPMVDIVSNHEITEDYLGIFSWKFPSKTGVFKKKLFWLMKNNPDADVYILCNQVFKEGYLEFTEKYHPGFKDIFYPLCEDLGLKVEESKFPIYSNFFIMKTELYKDYVNTIIKPAIELLETKYKDLAWRDAQYLSGLKQETLKEFTGLDYYTFHTFVLERLVNQYVSNKNLTFKQLI